MWFVYELSYYGVPFYIGISANPYTRYYAHMTSPLTRCYQLTRFCIKHYNIFPDIDIIDCAKNKPSARQLEDNYIVQRTKEGIELLNLRFIKLRDIKLPKGRIIPEHITNKLNNQILEFSKKYEHKNKTRY